MASAFTHGFVAVAAGKLAFPEPMPLRFWLLGALCSVLPDLDVIAFRFGVPYGYWLGHRGFSHSLLFAVLAGAAVALLAFRSESRFSKRWLLLAAYFTAVTASHGVLDAMTDGGYGIAFFSPIDDQRFFLPWRPLKVAPIGVRGFFSRWGWDVLMSELIWVWLPQISALIIAAIAIPDAGTVGGLAVFTNGMSASSAAFRVNGRRVKVLVGSTVTNAQVRYTLGPRAGDDSFAASSGPMVTVPAPGVLKNDASGLGGSSLTPILVTPAAHGDVLLQADGSFIYTPADPSSTSDVFSYRVDHGVALSPTATVNLSFGNRTFTSDDFSRSEVPPLIAPWLSKSGNWVITNAMLQAGPNDAAEI